MSYGAIVTTVGRRLTPETRIHLTTMTLLPSAEKNTTVSLPDRGGR